MLEIVSFTHADFDELSRVVMASFAGSRLNNTQGREHWGPCYTALLAGGGIRGGQLYGSSDATGAYPRDNPVAPEDLLAMPDGSFKRLNWLERVMVRLHLTNAKALEARYYRPASS